MKVIICLAIVFLITVGIIVTDVGTDEWRIVYKRGMYILEQKNIIGIWCEKWHGFTEEEVKEAERRFTKGGSQEYL